MKLKWGEKKMYNLFLEECDLLESVELANLLNEEVITEASIAGMKITKENLQDEKFVRELTKKIKNYKYDKNNKNEVKKFVDTLLVIIMFISAITIVLLPITFLLGALSIIYIIKEKNCVVTLPVSSLNDEKAENF